MKFNKTLIRSLKYLALVIVIFIAAVIVINLPFFDEKLLPEVKALLKHNEIEIDKGNAYIAIWGLSAPDDKPFYETGVNLMQYYKKIKKQDKLAEITDSDISKIVGKGEQDNVWLMKYKRCRSLDTSNCLEKNSLFLKENPVNQPRLIKMLIRYTNIVKMKKFQYIMESHITTPILPYYKILRLSQISLTKAYTEKESVDFISELNRDIEFWRMLLRQSNTLIDKMVSIAALRNDYQYLSAYLSQNIISKYEKATIKNMLTNLSVKEHNMSEVFKTETKMSLYFLQLIWRKSDNDTNFKEIINFALWQKNATFNFIYKEQFLPLTCISELTASKFYKFTILNNNSDCHQLKKYKLGFSPKNLYNPVGKILVSVDVPAYSNYIARPHDLDGLISLIKLQLALKSVDHNQWQQAINTSRIRNPYTGKPMTYDKEKQQLSFKCLDKNSVCKIKL